jgi:ABC-type transport system involved in multi-copper enzyme maturation permease subunit
MIVDLAHETRVMARYVLLEATRRRTFSTMTIITALLLALFAWAVRELHVALADVGTVPRIQVDPQQFAAHQLAGIALFGIFFIGAVLGVLLNHAAVRGDAEQGLLQQVVARPIGRTVLLLTRFAVVGLVCAAYVLGTYLLAAAALLGLGDWSPESVLLPGLWLAAGILVVCALTVVVSIFLPTSAAGILVFMLVGAGLGSGFVLELTATLGSDSLDRVAGTATWLLPFERCYQAAVAAASPSTPGADLLVLGPLAGGRDPGGLLLVWLVGWFSVVLAIGASLFSRRDL